MTVYRGQKTWVSTMDINANSLRRSEGSPVEREAFTTALLSQFRLSIAGAASGNPSSRKNLESLLKSAQETAVLNPFLSCSLSYSVARGFANAGDTEGYVLTMEGPWYNGADFEFLRTLFGLHAFGFDYLQEYGLPRRLERPFTLVGVEKVPPRDSTPEMVFP